YATDSQGEAAESPADDGGPADDALLSVIQPPIPVRELLGGIHDPGAQVEDNPAEGAKVADQVADQVLEVFVTEQVAQRRGEVLHVRGDISDEVLKAGAEVLHEVQQPRVEVVASAGEE